MTQGAINRILIWAGWILVVACTFGMVLCLWLWFINEISNRAMLGITLALSWLALVLSGAVFVLEAVVKKDVDSPG